MKLKKIQGRHLAATRRSFIEFHWQFTRIWWPCTSFDSSFNSLLNFFWVRLAKMTRFSKMWTLLISAARWHRRELDARHQPHRRQVEWTQVTTFHGCIGRQMDAASDAMIRRWIFRSSDGAAWPTRPPQRFPFERVAVAGIRAFRNDCTCPPCKCVSSFVLVSAFDWTPASRYFCFCFCFRCAQNVLEQRHLSINSADDTKTSATNTTRHFGHWPA